MSTCRCGGHEAGDDRHGMANADPCTAHPCHILVNQGRSEQHYADVYECCCGIRRLGGTDEFKARYGRGDDA